MMAKGISIRLMRPDEFHYPHDWMVAEGGPVMDLEFDRMWLTKIKQVTNIVAVNEQGLTCNAKANFLKKNLPKQKLNRCTDWIFELGDSEARFCLRFRIYCENRLAQKGRWIKTLATDA